ncbi:MAG: CpaD family pilus assembly protein [Micropepsaceae bacterium]
MKVFSRFAVIGLLAASVAGCATPAENSAANHYDAGKAFPIRVEPQIATLVVLVDSEGGGIVRGEQDRIQAFAEQWKARGHGALSVSVPTGTANQASANSAMSQVAKILSESDIGKKSFRVSSYKGAANDSDAPITLSFITDVAVAPECGTDWSENMAFTPRNLPWADFGCSSQHNLAAMIEDPRDLDHPRATDKADAMRRSTVLQKYRQGEATYTTLTGTRDSGVVSDMKQQ